jgi:ABC-type uncharacterized transport system substrate-binding protein
LPELAADLVRSNVDVILASAPSAIRAAMDATTKIPIVMSWWGGPDLVQSGIIASFARPGGNVTGVHMLLFPSTPSASTYSVRPCRARER